MQLKKILLLSSIIPFFIACNGATKQENLTIKKVGNYPYITWIKGKISFSKDDKYLFVVNNKTPNQIDILDISDLTTPKLFNTIILESKIFDYKISHNFKNLFITVKNNLMIYNISDLNHIQAINKIKLHINSTSGSFDITPDDRYLYVVGKNSTAYSDTFIYTYDIKNIKNIKNLELYKKDAYMLKVSPNGERLVYAVGGENNRIEMTDISNPNQIQKIDEYSRYFNNRLQVPYNIRPLELLFNEYSNKLYLIGANGGILIFDIDKGKLKKTDRFKDYTPIHSLKFLKNENYVFIGHSNYKYQTTKIDTFDKKISILLLGTNINISHNKKIMIMLDLDNAGIGIYKIERKEK